MVIMVCAHYFAGIFLSSMIKKTNDLFEMSCKVERKKSSFKRVFIQSLSLQFALHYILVFYLSCKVALLSNFILLNKYNEIHAVSRDWAIKRLSRKIVLT